jgi:hypothetical protein
VRHRFRLESLLYGALRRERNSVKRRRWFFALVERL